MSFIDFEECEVSGHLKGDGKKGQYWIMDDDWKYLELVTIDAAGPNIKKLGAFHAIDDAVATANLHDEAAANQSG